MESICSFVYFEDLAICESKLHAYTIEAGSYCCNLSKLNLANKAMPPDYTNCLTKSDF